MTTLKRASVLFLLINLFDHPNCLCFAADRILHLDTDFEICRFLTMDWKLRHLRAEWNGSLIQVLQIQTKWN